jgi:hypothetical protein
MIKNMAALVAIAAAAGVAVTVAQASTSTSHDVHQTGGPTSATPHSLERERQRPGGP